MANTIQTIQKTREYLDYVERHILNVNKAWEELNIKCRLKGFNWIYDDFIWNIINENIKHHDLSKLSISEFVQYRQYFYPAEGEEKNKELMNEGWMHHLGNNPHHWQYWTERDYAYPNQKLIYLIENICDWMAMGYEFGDTAQEYYENNKDKIILPEWAIKEMYKIFEIIYPQVSEGKK